MSACHPPHLDKCGRQGTGRPMRGTVGVTYQGASKAPARCEPSVLAFVLAFGLAVPYTAAGVWRSAACSLLNHLRPPLIPCDLTSLTPSPSELLPCFLPVRRSARVEAAAPVGRRAAGPPPPVRSTAPPRQPAMRNNHAAETAADVTVLYRNGKRASWLQSCYSHSTGASMQSASVLGHYGTEDAIRPTAHGLTACT